MPIRNQANLGDSIRETRKDQNMNGTLLFGKVIKVYPKHHSADVQLLNNQYGSLVTASENEGKFSCRILENFAGIDSNLDISYGTITPIQVGCYVVVGFLNNKKSQPIILGCLHDSNSIASVDNTDSFRKIIITRLQDYFTMSGDGDIDLVHHSGAFLSLRNEDIDESFDEDSLQLSEKIKQSKTPSTLDFIAGIRTFSGFVKLLVKGISGVVKLIKTGSENLSLFEVDEDGSLRIRVQTDSNSLDDECSYSQLKLDIITGDVSITQYSDGKTNEFNMSKTKGVLISSSNVINITNSSSINVKSESTINLSAPNINIDSRDETSE